MTERPFADTYSVQIGMLYRRLNQLAKRIAKVQGRGGQPHPFDVAEVKRLRADIARLKAGGDGRP